MMEKRIVEGIYGSTVHVFHIYSIFQYGKELFVKRWKRMRGINSG